MHHTEKTTSQAIIDFFNSLFTGVLCLPCLFLTDRKEQEILDVLRGTNY